MKTKFTTNSAGVSLLEVLLSMIILGVGILGMAPMMVLSIEGNVMSRNNTLASSILKAEVEYYENLDSLPSLPFRDVESNIENLFTRTTYIRDNGTDSSIPDGLCQIDVSLSWEDNSNMTRTSSYSTYIVAD